MKMALTIQGLNPGLPERGKIKIGRKGAFKQSNQGKKFQLPEKLDHFLVTTVERGEDNNFIKDNEIHTIIGENPTEIPIRLLYDDIGMNFPSRYAKYNGKTITGKSDNVTIEYIDKDGNWITTPVPENFSFYENVTSKDKWKMNGNLSVMIDGAQAVGGVWKFRTTSYNSIVGIMSSLALIKSITGGPLAGIPLLLCLRPKTVTTPDGKSMKAFVASVEFRGTVPELRERGYETLLLQKQHDHKVEHIESQVKLLLSSNAVDFGVDEDVIEEFAPENISEITDNEVVTEIVEDNDPVEEIVKDPPVEEPEKEVAKKKTTKKKEEVKTEPVVEPESEKQEPTAVVEPQPDAEPSGVDLF